MAEYRNKLFGMNTAEIMNEWDKVRMELNPRAKKRAKNEEQIGGTA